MVFAERFSNHFCVKIGLLSYSTNQQNTLYFSKTCNICHTFHKNGITVQISAHLLEKCGFPTGQKRGNTLNSALKPSFYLQKKRRISWSEENFHLCHSNYSHIGLVWSSDIILKARQPKDNSTQLWSKFRLCFQRIRFFGKIND